MSSQDGDGANCHGVGLNCVERKQTEKEESVGFRLGAFLASSAYRFGI